MGLADTDRAFAEAGALHKRVAMTELSRLEINLARLEANVEVFRRVLARSKAGLQPTLCAVVKADAYGLGAVPLAKHLAASGVDMFAVYSPAEARELVRHSTPQPILVLMPLRELIPDDPLCCAAKTGRLHLSIHDPEQIVALDRVGRALGCRLPVHLYVDTGMSRSGLSAAQLAAVLSRLPTLPHVQLKGVMSHLATADDDPAFAEEQRESFNRLLQRHRELRPASGVLAHLGNTCATLRSQRYHHQMVRIGLGLWGYGAELLEGQTALPEGRGLKPIVRWLSRIDHIQTYPKGTAVGYHRTYRLRRDSVLGVVPVGYAEGYPLALSNRAVVRVLGGQGRPILDAPVLGRVSMDQIVVDLTELSGQRGARVGVGSTVELVSDDPSSPCALPRLAHLAGSSCYEMLCRLSPRVPRRYIRVSASPSPPSVATPTPEQKVTIVSSTLVQL